MVIDAFPANLFKCSLFKYLCLWFMTIPYEYISKLVYQLHAATATQVANCRSSSSE